MSTVEKDTIKCESVFNDTRTHRFLWKRVWNKDLPLACVIMLNPCQADNIITDTTTAIESEDIIFDEWFLVSENVEGTVYNAVPEQCDNDCLYTASMFRLNLNDVYSHRIIAMERTFKRTYANNTRTN